MIKDVENLNFKNYDKGESPYRKYYVYNEGEDAGYIVIDIIYDRAEIVDVFVKEEFRNRKIGTNMLEYVINLIKDLNLVNITLEVRANNTYAIKLYEKFGFKEVAVRKSYYNGIDGLLMELML